MIRLSVNAKKELNRGADQILGDGRIVIGIERDNHKEIENCQNQKKDEEIKVVDYSQFEASTKSGIHAKGTVRRGTFSSRNDRENRAADNHGYCKYGCAGRGGSCKRLLLSGSQGT